MSAPKSRKWSGRICPSLVKFCPQTCTVASCICEVIHFQPGFVHSFSFTGVHKASQELHLAFVRGGWNLLSQLLVRSAGLSGVSTTHLSPLA